jgi:transposase-like protein
MWRRRVWWEKAAEEGGVEGTEGATVEETAGEDSDPTEGEGGGEVGEGGEGEEPSDSESQFFNLGEVPTELRPHLTRHYKRMQASFTRKMMGASDAMTKAAAFDRIVADPAFQVWMDQQRNGTGPDEPTGKSSRDTSEGGDVLRAMIEEVLDQKLRPMVEHTRNSEREKIQVQARQEFDQFKKDFPDWTVYKDEMKEEMSSNPRLSYAQAYKIVAYGDGVAGKALNRMEAKKKANVARPSSRPGEGEPAPAKTIQEAYLLAKKQLERGR